MAYYGKRKWLEALRKQKGWSQARLGAEIGVSQTQYLYIEKGYRDPSQEMKKLIADQLGIDVETFDRNDAEMRRRTA